MTENNTGVRISVIIPVGWRHSDIRELYADYRAGLDVLRVPYEFVFVLDGPHPEVMSTLNALIESERSNIVVVALNRAFGESTAIMTGFERSSGSVIMTLPAYHQIDSADISKLVAKLDASDVAVGWRWPRAGGMLERMRRGLFH